MRKLNVFNGVSLDGYFTSANGDMRWAHSSDPEWTAFAAENAKADGVMLFGRKTYEMMVSYWPTPAAKQNAPEVADFMNNRQKIVFSRMLDKATWQNTTLMKGDVVEEVRKLKQQPGPDLLIMGSGTIISPLADAGLIDEFQIALAPIAIGNGRTMFEGLTHKLNLKLTQSRAFSNGHVYLRYATAA